MQLYVYTTFKIKMNLHSTVISSMTMTRLVSPSFCNLPSAHLLMVNKTGTKWTSRSNTYSSEWTHFRHNPFTARLWSLTRSWAMPVSHNATLQEHVVYRNFIHAHSLMKNSMEYFGETKHVLFTVVTFGIMLIPYVSSIKSYFHIYLQTYICLLLMSIAVIPRTIHD